jgi:hypothetical protein
MKELQTISSKTFRHILENQKLNITFGYEKFLERSGGNLGKFLQEISF